LYRRGAYLPPDYRDTLRDNVAPLIAKHRLGRDQRQLTPAAAPAASTAAAMQPTLF
jgi:hypothetical protein